MEQEAFNLSVRKFLKTVGVGSQHQIEQAVEKAIASGAMKGGEPLAATMTLKIAALGLDVTFDGRIELQ
jgi:predicted lactoylglutathione lyase